MSSWLAIAPLGSLLGSQQIGFLVSLGLTLVLLAWMGTWLSRNSEAAQEAHRRALLDALFARFELRQEADQMAIGVHLGWRIGMGVHFWSWGFKRYSRFSLRLDPELQLPDNFLVVPQWFVPSPIPSPHKVLKTEVPTLDGLFFFQCDDAQQGHRLLDDPRVQDALLELAQSSAALFIEHLHLRLTYPKDIADEATVRRDLERMQRLATALRTVLGLHSPPRQKGVKTSA